MRALFLTFMLCGLCLAPIAAQKATPAQKTANVVVAPVNLNTATQSQLEGLPGIGPSTAQRIIEYRQKNGSFKKIEDLMNVRGIGEKSFLKLKPIVSVGDKPDHSGEAK